MYGSIITGDIYLVVTMIVLPQRPDTINIAMVNKEEGIGWTDHVQHWTTQELVWGSMRPSFLKEK
jgi:hypothetical protein